MLFFLFIILLAVILFFIIIPQILLLLSNRDYIKLLNDYINTEIKKPFFSYNRNFNQNKKIDNSHLIFVPHPFTNWSLNPNYFSKKGFYEHTLEGFKKTIKNDSLIEFIDKSKNLKNIFLNLKPKIIKEENAIWFDVEDIMQKNLEFFLDKMHFTEQGNDFFSSLLAEKVIKTFSF